MDPGVSGDATVSRAEGRLEFGFAGVRVVTRRTRDLHGADPPVNTHQRTLVFSLIRLEVRNVVGYVTNLCRRPAPFAVDKLLDSVDFRERRVQPSEGLPADVSFEV